MKTYYAYLVKTLAFILFVFLAPNNTFSQCSTTITTYPYNEGFESVKLLDSN